MSIGQLNIAINAVYHSIHHRKTVSISNKLASCKSLMLLKKLLPRQYEVTTQIMGGLKVEQHLQLIMLLLFQVLNHLRVLQYKKEQRDGTLKLYGTFVLLWVSFTLLNSRRKQVKMLE